MKAIESMMKTEWPDSQSERQNVKATLLGLDGRVQVTWRSRWWDGPLSGACNLDGEPGFWFDTCWAAEDCFDRLYVVFCLSDEQWRLKQQRHSSFQAHVSGAGGVRRPKRDHHLYYDREFAQEPPLEWSQAVGWATSLNAAANGRWPGGAS